MNGLDQHKGEGNRKSGTGTGTREPELVGFSPLAEERMASVRAVVGKTTLK
ncbi:hypothetical protein HQN87_01960 [Paenibacillus tritici]|uniref:Uncharacterized protein n=1 Tax=Paenibacillus tritici TaxID=1873425 RepID=A0ABX2DHJ0_9BACL|nr:hypothetical protein [Paenibacillus tritici]NQX44083.1 hypothetical protein [Paenibacillus tritici]